MENKIAYAEKIRDSYVPHERTGLDELKSLDRKVKKLPQILALTLGIIAALIFGTGMCLAMRVIGNLFAVGIVVGCIGIALCIANYFIYKAVLKSRKNKYGAKIVEISNEILNN